MSNNITINLKNCGCGCGGSSGSGSPPEYQPPIYNQPGDPTGTLGPPEGYTTASGLADRQCKMAVWIYSWIDAGLNFFGTTTNGKLLLQVSGTIKNSGALSFTVPIASTVVSAIITFLAIPEPSDVIKTALVYTVASAYVAAIGKIEADLTQPFVADMIPYIHAAQSDIICALSRATNANDARQRLSRVMQTAGISDDQEAFINAITPTALLTMLFYSADWWPSFDDDILAGITATCCGTYTDGDPITPGSMEECQASYYVVDQLAVIMASTGSEFTFWEGPFQTKDLTYFSSQQDIYEEIDRVIVLPAKGKELMTSYQAFLNAISTLFYNRMGYFSGLLGSDFDPGYAALADYITTNRATLATAIQGQVDQSAVFTALYSDLSTQIDAIITDVDEAVLVKQSLAAIITPTNRDDWMDLLFVQDSDLLLYAGAECGGGSMIWTFDTDAEDWTFTNVSNSTGAWSADNGGSLEITLPTGGGGGIGSWQSDVLAIVATPTTQLTVQFIGTPCASSDTATIIYDDASSDLVTIGPTTDALITVPVSVGNIGKTIVAVAAQSLKGPACDGADLTHYVDTVTLIY